MMQNYERRIIRGREVEFRLLSAAEFRRGIVRYQVWAILPDGRQVLVGEAANRTWAVSFVRMIPKTSEGHEIKVMIVESNGLKQEVLRPESGSRNALPNQGQNHAARLKRQQGGRIDWASYGREE